MTKVKATMKWCSISNAINAKYKTMIENDEEDKASEELDKIKQALVNLNFFKEEDFRNYKSL